MEQDKDNQEVITFRGNRNEWYDFSTKVKKNRTSVWNAIRGLLKGYKVKR